MKKILAAILIIIGGLLIFFLAGPRPEFEKPIQTISPLAVSIEELESYIEKKESGVEDLKPDNEARIIWADSVRKTPYSMVYLHGFSASQREGDPVHRTIAEMFGMNLYLSRIAGHGINSEESFVELTPEAMVKSAREAIAIGNIIGEKVIVMSCSTGGTYSIYLATQNPDMIDALIMYSPNLKLYDPTVDLVTGPWGRFIAETVGGKYRIIEESIGTEKEKYNTTTYRIEGIIALQALLEQTMIDNIFRQVKQPTFIGYYYKNEEEMDKVISVDRIREYVKITGTPDNKLEVVEFEHAGTHVVPSGLDSKDIESVIEETRNYMINTLKIDPVTSEKKMGI